MTQPSKSSFLASMKMGAISNFGFAASGMLFAILFGIAATSAGMSVLHAVLMSATFFSSAGQFAALEFWQTPLPYATLAVSTILISSRLALLSVAMVPYITERSLLTRMAGFFVLLDPNALLVMNFKGPHDPLGVLVGGGLSMYVTWIFGTFIGATFTNILAPDTIAALGYAGVLFIAMIMTMVARSVGKHWVPWAISGLSAAALSLMNVPPSIVMIIAVLAGTITGIVKAKVSND